jgi:hypothetical protein
VLLWCSCCPGGPAVPESLADGAPGLTGLQCSTAGTTDLSRPLFYVLSYVLHPMPFSDCLQQPTTSAEPGGCS